MITVHVQIDCLENLLTGLECYYIRQKSYFLNHFPSTFLINYVKPDIFIVVFIFNKERNFLNQIINRLLSKSCLNPIIKGVILFTSSDGT